MPLSFAAIDFETANASSASACAVGMVVVDDGAVTRRDGWLIRPPAGHDHFTEWNTRIHGIRAEQVTDADDWAAQFPRIVELAGGRPLVAHNARFDMTVIRAACDATGVPVPPLPYFCSLQLARRTWKLESYRLPVAARAAGFGAFAHHDALADAEACAAIVLGAAARHGADDVPALLAAAGCTIAQLRPADEDARRPMLFAGG